MTMYKSWEEASAEIRKIVGLATKQQKKLVKFLKIDMPDTLPHMVVASKLRDYLSSTLLLPSVDFPSERDIKRIEFLKKDEDGPISPSSKSEGEAWVDHLRLLRRVEHIELLKIREGDIVEISGHGYLAEVSSIGQNGRVFFKGGRGAGAWPDLLTVRAKADDKSKSAIGLREKANNYAASRAYIGHWTSAKHAELATYSVYSKITNDDIEQLELLIDLAEDEAPIQKHLEENRHILAALLGGRDRYCISQKRLGSEYVPDFLISDTNSVGISWFLIELETPNSTIYLRNGQLDKYARKGVAQILEWREWLANNISYARRRKKDDGLGLIDIRADSQAFVLVGRRRLLKNEKEVHRHQLKDKENIHVHTYDWLIEQLRGILAFSGPPGCNPYLVEGYDGKN